ncbi:GNAT family N-acetyltransferase [Roseobacter sinensis]|uniref:GNAT family N-acetyltransferase n=1 Tax=Roseobacter sinensis TaxID=2931391 RepID=A0ABT3BJT5_9RHOB|nr:GNAT family N-acetyltransferase [Roseobacter sp. WL0113]MCV3273842.1 GNAT family N-acetyltransferase [Roseobacter sp. WL0113]
MTHIDIRTTEAGDIPGLQGVLQATALFPAELLPELLAPSLDGQSPALWLTAMRGGTPAGLCYCLPEEMTEGTWNMRALALHPDWHGRGYGAALVAAAEQQLRAAGHRLLLVDTSSGPSFAGACRFYARVGYEEEARIRDFWAAGDDKIVFRKSL